MSNKRLFIGSLLLLFTGLLGIVYAAPQPPEHNTRTFRNALNQQGIQSILQSIEERLRNLDHIYAVRYSTRTDPNTEQYVRRIEMLETKLSRIESLIEVQLEKISENMSSKNFKDDITKDQIFRKIDSVYERINHKLGYMEGKLEMDILKLQSKVETGITKTERLDHNIGVRHSDLEAEITEAVDVMASVKSGIGTIENKVINVTRRILEKWNEDHIRTIDHKFSNISHTISSKLENNMNHSCQHYNQKDSPTDFSNKDMSLIKRFTDYEDKIHSYGNKMNNMYNELWKKSVNIEDSVRNSLQVTNQTRKEIQDNMKNLLKQFGSRLASDDTQNDGTLEIIIDSFTNTIERKFSDMGRKLDSNFQNVMLTQNLFLESCHRIQMDEAQLENKISLVLEKLIDVFTNKSAITFAEIQNMEEMIKSHDAHIYRSLAQNTNTIIKLSEKTSDDRKKLEKIIAKLKQDIVNSLSTVLDLMNSENEGYHHKINTITSILQELQEQVNDLDNRVNEDNVNYNLKQIQQDVLQIKYAVDKDDLAQVLNNTILDSKKSFTMLENLTQNIYHTLNNIDVKLNRTHAGYYANRNNKYQPSSHRFAPVLKTNVKYFVSKDEFNSTVAENENGKQIKDSDINEMTDIILQILPDNNVTNLNSSNMNNFMNEDELDTQLIDHVKDRHISFLKRFNYSLFDREINQEIGNDKITNNTGIMEGNNPKILNITNAPVNVDTFNQNVNNTFLASQIMVNEKDIFSSVNIEDKAQNQNQNTTDISIVKPIPATAQSNNGEEIIINGKHILDYPTISLSERKSNKTSNDFGIIINGREATDNIEKQENISTFLHKDGFNSTNVIERSPFENIESSTIPSDTLISEYLITDIPSGIFNIARESKEQVDSALNTTGVQESFGNTGVTNKTERTREKMASFNLTDIFYEDNFNIAQNTTQFQDSFEYTDLKNGTNEDVFSEQINDLHEIQEYDEDYFD